MKKKIIIFTSCFIALLGLTILFYPEILTVFKKNVSQDVTEQPKELRMKGYEDMEKQVNVDSEIAFNSEKENLTMDIYTPKKLDGEKKPVIFLAHGGAFIAGDKKSFADYSVMLASEGYIVVNINYGLAPAYTYPSPLEDIREAYQYAKKHQSDYNMDLDRVAFGGASAGGQIMGQFVNIQVDEKYAEKVDMEPVVDADSIQAIIFFSALLDFNKYDVYENGEVNEIFHKSGQAYFDEAEWKQLDEVQKANVVGNVGDTFPPTYITDGNTASFEDQARELEEELEEEDVPVTTSFFSTDEAELRHQYQFNMQLEQSVENYEEVVKFLDEYLK
ncbi:MAG TPA: alpha/beta hydrolase [Pseudogracilibacillus sp.]|nr:alpha/beta hydrolase [Pseudogracilibacillus sp.]